MAVMYMCSKSIIFKSLKPTSHIYYLLQNRVRFNYQNVLSSYISSCSSLHVYGQRSVKFKSCKPISNHFLFTPHVNISTSATCFKLRRTGENKASIYFSLYHPHFSLQIFYSVCICLQKLETKQSSFKVKIKPTTKVITIWNNMTVMELAEAMGKDLGKIISK